MSIVLCCSDTVKIRGLQIGEESVDTCLRAKVKVNELQGIIAESRRVGQQLILFLGDHGSHLHCGLVLL